METLPISVITVGYRGAPLLERMLTSLLAATPPPAEVILVDNASPEPLDAVMNRFVEAAPRAGIRALKVKAPRNLGFGGGNALGLEHATQPLVLLLNPDTELEPATLRVLFEAAAALPGPCAVQPLVLFSTRRSTINSAGIATFLDGAFIDMLCDAPLERLEARDPVEIVAATASCILFPRDLPARFGFFDPDFFLYFEDVDLGLRWRRLGVRAYLVPRAIVYHHYHGSTQEGLDGLRFEMARNQIETVAKNYPALEVAASAVFWSLVTAVYLVGRNPGEGVRRLRAAAFELRRLPALREKRRKVLALGPDARVRPWIVMPGTPPRAGPPQVRPGTAPSALAPATLGP